MNSILERFITEFHAIYKSGETSVSLPPKDVHDLRKSLESEWMHQFHNDPEPRFMGVKITVDRTARSLQLPHYG